MVVQSKKRALGSVVIILFFCGVFVSLILVTRQIRSQVTLGGSTYGGVNFPTATTAGYPPTPLLAVPVKVSGNVAFSDALPYYSGTNAYWGVIFNEQNTNEPEVFCTDPSHPLGSAPTNSSWVTTAYSGQHAWSLDMDYIAAGNSPDSAARTYFMGFNINAFASGTNPCGSSWGPSDFTPYGSFGRTNLHTFYGVLAAHGVDPPFSIYSCSDPTTSCTVAGSGAAMSLVIDWSALMTGTFGLSAPSITTDGEVTVSDNETWVTYWFGGGQDSARYYGAYNISTTCAYLVDLQAGNEYATLPCGLGDSGSGYTLCSGCITNGTYNWLTSGSSGGGIHRAVMDADGDAINVTNQNNSVGFQIWPLPSSSSWPATPFTQSTGTTPSYFQNHFAFFLGDYVFNGLGDTGLQTGVNVAWRIRSILNPDNTYFDLANTFNYDAAAGEGSHQNCDGALQNLTMPCASAQFSAGQGAGPITLALTQEVVSVAVNHSSPAIYRFGNHHAHYMLGSPSITNGVVGNGTTVTVTTISNHDFSTGQATIAAYDCTDATANATALTVTRIDSLDFSYSSSYNSTTTCRYINQSNSNGPQTQDFWGSSLIQVPKNFHCVLVPTSWEGTMAPDTHDGNGCNNDHCPAKELLFILTH